MHPSFRTSMNLLHTWAGVILGGVLFAIFWMGSLSVFDREIDRWMMPTTRLAVPAARISVDALRPHIEAAAPGASQWGIWFPSDRVPTVYAFWFTPGRVLVRRHANPATSEILDDIKTLGATGFFYPFHYGLHINIGFYGRWLVVAAAMGMMIMLITGVIFHVRIFKDFFVLRWRSKNLRRILDLHNLAGVLGLPFHFMISFTGVAIFLVFNFPLSWQPAFGGNQAALNREMLGAYSRPALRSPASSVSLDQLVEEAERIWGGGRAHYLRVWHPGDAASFVEIRRAYADGIPMHLDVVNFDAHTGEVLNTYAASPVMHVQRIVAGLHFIQFRHWPIRFLYFFLGLLGCALIATGLLFWIESRRKRHQTLGLAGVRIVEGMTIGCVTGIIIATGAFLIANRLLPSGMHGRTGAEMGVFYIVWVLTFAHAWWRKGAAWREQCLVIATIAAAAVVLNAATTGDHLTKTILNGQWSVAGVDIGLIVTAMMALASANRLGRTRPRASD